MKSCFKFINVNDLIINEKFKKVFKDNGIECLDDLLNFEQGEVFRKNNLRSVVKIELNDSEQKRYVFHLKRHKLNFKERIKAFFRKGYSEDGENEWNKILALHDNDINTMIPAVFGIRKKYRLPFISATVTEHLYDCLRLEDLLKEILKHQSDNEKKTLKKTIIRELALLCRKFHELGFCHKDFYLGHFFVKLNPFTLYLIDLQRVFKNDKISTYHKLKDLSQLYYSSTLIDGINIKDRLAFFKIYLNKFKIDLKDRNFIKDIIYKSFNIQKHTDKMLKKGGWK